MTEQSTTRFGLIRHAPTVWNEKKLIQGQLDSALTEDGKTRASEWGKQLRFFSWQRIMCSDLGRTMETALRINSHLKLPVLPEKKVREQDWGRWSGMSLASIHAQHGKCLDQQVQAGWNFRPPGGESRRQVLDRCLTVLKQSQETYPGEMILLVCHEGVIKCLIYHLLNRRFMPDEPRIIRSCHLHLLSAREGIIYLDELNRLALHRAKDY